jgi:hypothetical protein
MIKIPKAALAFLDWFFLPHGYDTFHFAYVWFAKLVKGEDIPARRGYILYKCKMCGKMYSANKRNKTCQNIGCFIKWRIK